MLKPPQVPRHVRDAERAFSPTREALLKERSSPTGRWLLRTTPGFCKQTTIAGDCTFGSQGSWPLPRNLSTRWFDAAEYCIQLCLDCPKCAAISITLQHKDCSWYSECDTRSLSHHGMVADVRTANVRRRHRPRTCLSTQTRSKGRYQAFSIADLDCDERYASYVNCGGRRFLFTRREVEWRISNRADSHSPVLFDSSST
jgi:hypothetical protein